VPYQQAPRHLWIQRIEPDRQVGADDRDNARVPVGAGDAGAPVGADGRVDLVFRRQQHHDQRHGRRGDGQP